jgi:hypothetical protein
MATDVKKCQNKLAKKVKSDNKNSWNKAKRRVSRPFKKHY